MRMCFTSVLLGVLLVSTAACQSGQVRVAPTPSHSPSRVDPTPGGWVPPVATPPAAPMSDLEQAVAARLGKQVAREGLDLQYVACPPWPGKAPHRMTCLGYLDGLTANIRVRLSRLTGGAVSFRARLANGLIATAELERKLRADGFHHVDCGDHQAYPAVRGRKVVCRVTRNGQQRFVVATVTNRSGAVMIRGY
jgi:hypothetical protein